MNRFSLIGLALALSGLFAPVAAAPETPPAIAASITLDPASIAPRQPAPNDRSEYRRFVLPNGMKVILLSDPKFNSSSASLAVAVGSFSDPRERRGMAHFLEHMLFLGTEKYPDVTDFSAYLGRNGGYNNAYTAGDRTNYHFEIRHEAFEGALDRFAQFFIAPLFSAQFTEREMNAVNSEHQKNLETDGWRENQLRNTVYRAGHPASGFSTGNRETLAGTTREELLAFYNQNYSANRMTLALTGKASLDQLEQWARSRFSPVVDRQFAPLRYPADYFPPKPALRMLRMEPLKDLRHLSLEFPLPGLNATWASKPAEQLSFILGGEGPGSLLARLKAEGLATGLSAGASASSSDFGAFEMQVSLTPDGLDKLPRVFDLVFAAISTLRSQGAPAHLFKERQTLAQLDERYRDQGEGANRAMMLSNMLQDYPLAVAERVPYVWVKDDPAALQALVAQLRPDNLLATLVAKGVKTDRVEPIYGTRYSYTEDSGAAYTALLKPPGVAGLQLPKANPFIPARTTLLPVQPVRLLDEPALTLHHAQDVEFQRPLVAHMVRFRLPRSMASLRTAVLLRFYEASVREALNEITYTASEAGLRFNFSAGLEGVVLAVEGYDEAAGRLLDATLTGIVDPNLPPARFAALKDRVLRELAAFERADAYTTVGETRSGVVREFHFRPDEQLAMARGVTQAEVRAFAKALYAKGKLEALSYGNVNATDATSAARRVARALGTVGVPERDLLRRRLLRAAPGESVRTSEKLQVNNSALRREYVLGDDTPEMRAATLVLGAFVADPFFAEMRTRQQLGYIVFGGAGNDTRSLFAYFIVQSGEYPADALEARAEVFINQFPALLASLPNDAWQTLVAGARARLEESDKSIAERAQRLFDLAYERNGDWARRQATLDALSVLTQQRAGEILSAAISPASRRMRTFLGFSRDHVPQRKPEVSFSERDAWKKGRRYE